MVIGSKGGGVATGNLYSGAVILFLNVRSVAENRDSVTKCKKFIFKCDLQTRPPTPEVSFTRPYLEIWMSPPILLIKPHRQSAQINASWIIFQLGEFTSVTKFWSLELYVMGNFVQGGRLGFSLFAQETHVCIYNQVLWVYKIKSI